MNEEKLTTAIVDALIKDIRRTEYAKGFYSGILMVVGIGCYRAFRKGTWNLSNTSKDKPEEN